MAKSVNKNALLFFSNSSYLIASNLLSFLISALAILVVPKLIGVEEYGYWQLYLLYTSYVGIFHFGWCDGIYLRYGGKVYQDLDKNLFFSQFLMLALLQLIFAIFLSSFTAIYVNSIERNFILHMTSLCLFTANLRRMLLVILQGTNRIREYAIAMISGRFLYFILAMLLLFLGLREYRTMIIADFVGNVLSLFMVIYYCKEIVLNKLSDFVFNFNEALKNIRVGINLMGASIASNLIIGVVRFGIERFWSIATFGSVSLTLSVSGFLMVFINALGIVLFPLLRRSRSDQHINIYTAAGNILSILLIGLMVFYFPFKLFLSNWLPQYSDGLRFMALLFPLSIYEGRYVLLVNTYLKSLRKEKLILRINIISLILSVLFSILTTMILRNLNLAVLSILFIIGFRCILGEYKLSKSLGIDVLKETILELIMTIIFITSGWFLNTWTGVIYFLSAYIIFLIIKRKDIIQTTRTIKSLVKT